MLVHLFVNPHTDGTDSTKTQPSHWNAEHSFSGSNTGSLLYRDVLASNGANWLTPSPSPGFALLSSGAGAPPVWGAVITPVFPLAATAGGTGVVNNVANTITFSGNFGLTLTLSGATSVTFPTSGTLLSTTSPALTANAIVLGGGSGVVPTVVGSLGTTTTLLHGNAAGAPSFGAVVNADIANATIDLTTKVTGTLPIGNGGLGVTTLTNHGILIGQGAASPVATSTGTAGQLLTSNGAAADPTFQGPVSQTTALTGTQNDFALSTNCRNLYCTNATILTFTGFAAGYDGQKVRIYSNGTGQIDIVPQLAGTASAAANRVICAATIGNTSAAPGVGWFEIEYSTTFSRWVLTGHEQGALITPAFSAISYTSSAGTWTVAAGNVTANSYYLKGKLLSIHITIANTAVSNAAVVLFAIMPGSYQAITAQFYPGANRGSDNGAGVLGMAGTNALNNRISFWTSFSGAGYGVSAAAAGVDVSLVFEVQ